MKGSKLGTFFELGGRGEMEALACCGLDYVIIDTEHGCFSEETTADLILAAENRGLLPYVRIGDIRRPYVLRMLDIGARGLIVPNIRTAEQVKELVSYAKFPPVGNRGFCPNRTSGWGRDAWAKDAAAYMAECNRRCKVIPQCETVSALERIDEIAGIPGVDGIFVGPCDLSIDMGIPLDLNHPALTEAIQRIFLACRKHGKETYIFAGNMKDAVTWTARGFDGIAYSLDASVFIGAWQSIIRDYRENCEGRA